MKVLIAVLLAFNLSAQDSWRFTSDKQLHFGGCGVVSLFVSSIHGSNGHEFDNIKGGLMVGAITGVSLGLGKELIYDKWMGRGNPSVQDFGYSVLGTAVGCAITYGFYKLTDGRKKNKDRNQEMRVKL